MPSRVNFAPVPSSDENATSISHEEKTSSPSHGRSLFHFFATPFVALYHFPKFLYNAVTQNTVLKSFCNFNVTSSIPLESKVESASRDITSLSPKAQELRKINSAYKNLKQELQAIDQESWSDENASNRIQQRCEELNSAYEDFFDGIASCEHCMKQAVSEQGKEAFRELLDNISDSEPLIGDLAEALKRKLSSMDDWKKQNPDRDEQGFFSEIFSKMRSYARELVRECELHLG